MRRGGTRMAKHGLGAAIPRKEDDRFLRGCAQYVGDIPIVGMRDAAFVRSPVAHAVVRRIVVPERYKNVVFTAADLSGVKGITSAPALKNFKTSTEPILAADKLRYVGEPAAICLAGTRAEAEDIAATIVIEYDELPAVTDMLDACRPGAPLVHAQWRDNIFIEVSEGRLPDGVLDAAPIKVSKQIRTSRQCAFPMERRGIVAQWDARLDYLTLITSTQIPHTVQSLVAECLALDDASVRVISPDVGGGFGSKCVVSREEIAVAWLALRTGRAVRWLEDCREQLIAGANCREHHYQITGYASADGKLLAVDCVAHVDAGAYSAYPVAACVEAVQLANIVPGPYDLPAYRCKSFAVCTNKPPILAYRGVGRTGACLAIEAIMDAVADEAGLAPDEVRVQNLVGPEQMPFTNVVGKHFDSGDHRECVRRAAEAIKLAELRSGRSRPSSHRRLLGVGLCIFVEQAAHGASVLAGWGRTIVPGREPAVMRLTADGNVEIRVGTHSHGQGHETTFAQVAHEILGVELDKIKLLQGDTLFAPHSTGTWGSRSMVLAGGAIARAARVLAGRAAMVGAWLMQKDAAEVEVANGQVVARDGSSVSLREIARTCYLRPQHLPPTIDATALEVAASYSAERDSGTFSYAAHAATVRIDTETGLIEILDYVVVEDGGVLVNPTIVDGQIRGGTAQGIGTCLYEASPYDAHGQPRASTLADYQLPTATEIPNIRVLHMQTPSPYSEFGLKGIGEGGAVGPPAAIVSAVNDALQQIGAQVYNLPLTPHQILSAIRMAQHGAGL
jgi:aerobic carbon-monoxide dehydrogenase large subunit